MVCAEKEIELRPVTWGPVVRSHLEMLLDLPGPRLKEWRDFMATGESRGLGLFVDDRHVATVLYNIQHVRTGPEFVVEAAAGGLAGVDLVLLIMPYLERLAAEVGCGRVHFRTARPGLVKKAEAQGYRPAEIWLAKDLAA